MVGLLDEALQETLVDEISHDLVCVENLTESTYIENFASLEDPLSDLSAKLLELTVADTFTRFTCVDCEGEYIRPVCVEIEACLRGDHSMLEDGKIVAELLEEKIKEIAQPLLSTVLLPTVETHSSGLEYAPTPFMGQFEYAHLESDA